MNIEKYLHLTEIKSKLLSHNFRIVGPSFVFFFSAVTGYFYVIVHTGICTIRAGRAPSERWQFKVIAIAIPPRNVKTTLSIVTLQYHQKIDFII
uniref:Uncharacterized protein n=1 Tax=Romanomermis culicivorax TaxID=13658 RepID=A0A915ITF6_ROMCU